MPRMTVTKMHSTYSSLPNGTNPNPILIAFRQELFETHRDTNLTAGYWYSWMEKYLFEEIYIYPLIGQCKVTLDHRYQARVIFSRLMRA